jgi:putative transcriptional regulator
MTISHHPSDALMLDYASGGIGPAAELAVAAHLAFCPHCRRTSHLLDSLGGRFLADSPEAALGPDSLEKIMARIAAPPAETPSPPHRGGVLPAPLRQALGCDLDGVPWKRLGADAAHHVIALGDSGATARLLKIAAGHPVPVHSHRGVELTLVLCGAFSDATGSFARGDFQEADDSLEHRPRAAPGEDCVCLAVTDAPLRFKSWAARLVQPILGI